MFIGLLFLLISSLSTISRTMATPMLHQIKRVDEYILTSALIDGLQRSNVCGEGYRIEGAVLKSYPYSDQDTYLPYEDCSMTFQARRSNSLMRIRIVRLDLNDIHAGANCLDSLRFYKSPFMKHKDKLNFVECGKVKESERFSLVSPTGIVTAHFNTDGGNVSGLGFKVILTAFRLANKSHPCDDDDEEFLCHQGDCISSTLLCDGVEHCLDGSDELANRFCSLNPSETLENQRAELLHRARLRKHQHWRGILIVAFLLIIFIAFTLFMAYLLCRRCFVPSTDPPSKPSKSISTFVNRNSNGPPTTSKTRHLEKDSNLL